jgi:hypothetical protein
MTTSKYGRFSTGCGKITSFFHRVQYEKRKLACRTLYMIINVTQKFLIMVSTSLLLTYELDQQAWWKTNVQLYVYDLPASPTSLTLEPTKVFHSDEQYQLLKLDYYRQSVGQSILVVRHPSNVGYSMSHYNQQSVGQSVLVSQGKLASYCYMHLLLGNRPSINPPPKRKAGVFPWR